MFNSNVENQHLNSTLIVDPRDLKCGDLKINVDGYPLSEEMFELLVSSGGGLKDRANNFLWVGVGAAVVTGAKLFTFVYDFVNAEDKNSVKLSHEPHETWSLILTFGLYLILYLASFRYKNRKDRLISNIRKFFKPEK